MPELPEVETIVRDLQPALTGRLIKHPRLFHSDVLYRVSARALLAGLRGRRIVEVSRRAKHAIFLLDSGSRLVIQPGMSGAMVVYRDPPGPPEPGYAVLTAELSSGSTFLYRDVRRCTKRLEIVVKVEVLPLKARRPTWWEKDKSNVEFRAH